MRSPPARRELAGAARRTLKRGGPTKADLYEIDLADGTVVIKDFAAKGFWGRLLGRLQIARECRAYAHAAGLDGVPSLVGRIDALALALERIDGVQLTHSPRRSAEGRELFERLRRVVAGLHAAGLAHLDLGGRENVLLSADGRVVVLDFASAIRLRPGGLAHRLLFGWLRRADDAALLKYKRLLEAGPYTAEEQAFLRRHRAWRALWIFNRKTPHPPRLPER